MWIGQARHTLVQVSARQNSQGDQVIRDFLNETRMPEVPDSTAPPRREGVRGAWRAFMHVRASESKLKAIATAAVGVEDPKEPRRH